jgi:hypothetical protein
MRVVTPADAVPEITTLTTMAVMIVFTGSSSSDDRTVIGSESREQDGARALSHQTQIGLFAECLSASVMLVEDAGRISVCGG